ncbi:MAG: NHLP leader peptide family natural product precursor [Chloroflexi bacterium]|nr:NHLP leader peptide family natural product precursor [Chloroflexota bacterium]
MAQSIRWSSIVEKAQQDPAFRQELLNNPRAALEKFSGVVLPEGINYIVHEQTPSTVHLVLPLALETKQKPDAFFVQDDDDGDGTGDGR